MKLRMLVAINTLEAGICLVEYRFQLLMFLILVVWQRSGFGIIPTKEVMPFA